MTLQRYIPEPDGLNAEFYRRMRDGSLHLQCCGECGRLRHPPRYLCAHCGSAQFHWTPSTGHGTIHSWVVTHFAFDRGWASETPYATAIVELDEGVRLVGHVATTDPSVLALGAEVELTLEPMTDDFVFLSFRPAGAADASG